jgi:hypothetical protein
MAVPYSCIYILCNTSNSTCKSAIEYTPGKVYKMSALDAHATLQSALDAHATLQSALDAHATLQSALDCFDIVYAILEAGRSMAMRYFKEYGAMLALGAPNAYCGAACVSRQWHAAASALGMTRFYMQFKPIALHYDVDSTIDINFSNRCRATIGHTLTGVKILTKIVFIARAKWTCTYNFSDIYNDYIDEGSDIIGGIILFLKGVPDKHRNNVVDRGKLFVPDYILAGLNYNDRRVYADFVDRMDAWKLDNTDIDDDKKAYNEAIFFIDELKNLTDILIRMAKD